MMKKSAFKTIAVLFGGQSLEHEISIISGLQALNALDATKYNIIPVYIAPNGSWFSGKSLWQRDFYKNLNFKKLKSVWLSPLPGQGLRQKRRQVSVDLFLPIFHGAYGENGAIQGLLELSGIPYAGSGILASAIGMNKALAKNIAKQNGIPVLPQVLLAEWNVENPNLKKIYESLALPLFVKPNNLGSSFGVSSAHSEKELLVSLAGAFALDHQVIVEPLVQNFTEINCSVFNGKVSVLEEPKKEGAFLSFEAKYLKGSKTKMSQGMASLRRTLNPPIEQTEQIKDWAKKIYEAIDCVGIARVDFMLDKDTDKIYFEEINTTPGSLAFYLWEPTISFTELLDDLINSSLERHKKNKRNFVIEKRIFN